MCCMSVFMSSRLSAVALSAVNEEKHPLLLKAPTFCQPTRLHTSRNCSRLQDPHEVSVLCGIEGHCVVYILQQVGVAASSNRLTNSMPHRVARALLKPCNRLDGINFHCFLSLCTRASELAEDRYIGCRSRCPRSTPEALWTSTPCLMALVVSSRLVRVASVQLLELLSRCRMTSSQLNCRAVEAASQQQASSRCACIFFHFSFP